MSGVQFMVDERGKKTAVVIDLKKFAGVWEDFYDSMLAEKRADEPREPLSVVKTRLVQAGKLRG